MSRGSANVCERASKTAFGAAAAGVCEGRPCHWQRERAQINTSKNTQSMKCLYFLYENSKLRKSRIESNNASSSRLRERLRDHIRQRRIPHSQILFQQFPFTRAEDPFVATRDCNAAFLMCVSGCNKKRSLKSKRNRK